MHIIFHMFILIISHITIHIVVFIIIHIINQDFFKNSYS